MLFRLLMKKILFIIIGIRANYLSSFLIILKKLLRQLILNTYKLVNQLVKVKGQKAVDRLIKKN